MLIGFGKRLENLREKYSYSKKEMSIKLGFTPNVYGSYEREERRPNLETLVKISEIFGVSLDYLILGEHPFSNDLSKEDKDEEQIKSLIHFFEEMGIDHPYFLQLEKWYYLSREDLVELSNHFDWVVNKAKSKKTHN